MKKQQLMVMITPESRKKLEELKGFTNLSFGQILEWGLVEKYHSIRSANKTKKYWQDMDEVLDEDTVFIQLKNLK